MVKKKTNIKYIKVGYDFTQKSKAPLQKKKKGKKMWKLSLRCLTSIDGRLVNQSICCSLHIRRHKTQFDVVLLQESILMACPHPLNVAEAKLRRCLRICSMRKHLHLESTVSEQCDIVATWLKWP